MKTKLIIIIIVLIVGVVATATGLSVAYWMGEDGDSEIAPQTDTTDWNYWSKYFIYEEVLNESGVSIGYKIVDFDGAVLENVIIPRIAMGGRLRDANGNLTEITTRQSPVLTVGNSTFADITDKSIPVTLTLPTTVEVEAGAFVGLTNLTTIKVISVVGHSSTTYDLDIVIGSQAFFGCTNVTKFIMADNIAIKVGDASVSFEAFVEQTGLPTGLQRTTD